MVMTSRYELAHPELFAELTPERRDSVVATLASDELENGEPTRSHIELLIRGITEQLTDEQYLDAVLEHVRSTSAQ